MLRTREEVMELMKNHKFKLKTFVLYGRNSLCKEYGDEDSPKYLGKDKVLKIYTEDTYLAFDIEKNTIEYLFDIKDVDKKYPDTRIINRAGKVCKIFTRPIFSLINFPDGEPAILMNIVKYDIRYAYITENLDRPSEIVSSKKWVLITRAGQVFASYSPYREYSADFYKASSLMEIKSLFSTYGLFDNSKSVDFFERPYELIYDHYIRKVFPRYVYYKRDFLDTKSQYNIFEGMLGYDEPQRKKSRNQEFIDKVQSYNIIDNYISLMTESEISEESYENHNSYRFSAVINRLDSKEDIVVIRIFPRGYDKDYLRLYVDKKKAVYAFLNRDGEWLAMPTPSVYQPVVAYNIPHMERYGENIVLGTKLQYILPLMLDKNIRNNGDGVYTLLKDSIVEEFAKSKYYLHEDGYIDQRLIRETFGKANSKKKGFFAKVGMTKKQLDLIYDYADLLIEKGLASFRDHRDNDKEYQKLASRVKKRYILSSFRALKKIFNSDEAKEDDYLNFTHIDINTFTKIFEIIKGSKGNDVFHMEDPCGYYYNAFSMAEHYNNRCLNILERVYKNYPSRAFQNMIEYLYNNVEKRIKYSAKTACGDTRFYDNEMEYIYEDYLNMVMELGENRSWYPPIEKLMEEHDNVIVRYNEFLNFKRSPEYINEHMEELAKKYKNLEYSDDEYTVFHPLTGREIIQEGIVLQHCVGSYVSNVVDGKTSIFFIRKVEEKEKPFFTLELKDGVIRQVHGKCNCGTDAVKGLDEFIEKWAKEKNLKYSKRQASACLAAGY